MAKNPKSGTAERVVKVQASSLYGKIERPENIGSKVTRTIRERAEKLHAAIHEALGVPPSEDVYGLIHSALLDQWVDGHDDASTAAVKAVSEATGRPGPRPAVPCTAVYYGLSGNIPCTVSHDEVGKASNVHRGNTPSGASVTWRSERGPRG